MSVLFITHDLALVGEIADRVIVMRHGEVREQGRRASVRRPQDAYTRPAACRPALDSAPRGCR
jgi:peptide/nickel transport system ATP-binding protein